MGKRRPLRGMTADTELTRWGEVSRGVQESGIQDVLNDMIDEVLVDSSVLKSSDGDDEGGSPGKVRYNYALRLNDNPKSPHE